VKKFVPPQKPPLPASSDLSELAARTEHACRTPLSIALTSVELLQRYYDRLTPEAREQHLANIHGAVLQLTGMLDEIIRPARRTAKPETSA
jgi:signal transduction histidine kinase